MKSHSLRMHANDDERAADMANPAAKHADEFRRETADRIISTGRPVTEYRGELGLNLPRFRYHPHLSTDLGRIQIQCLSASPYQLLTSGVFSFNKGHVKLRK